MIPQIIHYCWFGENELPPMALKCLQSWKKYFPEWEIILWNEENSPIDRGYMKNALKNKKWSNLSNYTRLHALKTCGGIYFDTDVEVIKKFEFIEKYSCFVGFESEPNDENISVNNAIIGAEKNHPFINQCLDEIELLYDGNEEANLSSPVLTTSILIQNGLKLYGEQDVENVHVFDMKTFYPYTWDDLFSYECVTEQTYTIHFWELSWKNNETSNKELILQMKLLKTNLKKMEQSYYGIIRGELTLYELLKINCRYLLNLLSKND